MVDLEKQIAEKKKQIAELRKVGQHIRELERKILGQKRTLTELEANMEKEYADIALAEKRYGGLYSLFVDMSEHRSELIEKEKEEYLQSVVVFRKAAHKLELLEFEINVLEEKERQLPEVMKELDQLLLKRKANQTKKAVIYVEPEEWKSLELQAILHKVLTLTERNILLFEDLRNTLQHLITTEAIKHEPAYMAKLRKAGFEKVEKLSIRMHEKMFQLEIALAQLRLPGDEGAIGRKFQAVEKALESFFDKLNDLTWSVAVNHIHGEVYIQRVMKLSTWAKNIQYQVNQIDKELNREMEKVNAQLETFSGREEK